MGGLGSKGIETATTPKEKSNEIQNNVLYFQKVHIACFPFYWDRVVRNPALNKAPLIFGSLLKVL